MSGSDQTSTLDARDCCEAEAPRPGIYNRPGLPALDYRIATHATALRRLLASLPGQRIADGPNEGSQPLRALTTRAADDPAIALLDAWATATDVLTFYQERIANEGYLRTATERLSVLELARSIGYELNPGVAASAFLAFTVESAPGAPGVATVPVGTRVQSIPGQGELPQTFETIEPIAARAEWNALRPRRLIEQEIVFGTRELYLRGITTQLQPGDSILLVGDERDADPISENWDFRILRTVTTHPPTAGDPGREGFTRVTWEVGLGSESPRIEPAAKPRVYAFRQRAALFGHNAPEWKAMATKIQRAYDASYDVSTDQPSVGEWPGFAIQAPAERVVDLDTVYPRILAGSWIVLVEPSYVELYRADAVTSAARTDFTLTAKTTRIQFDTDENLARFGLRETVVFAQSELLPLADRPLTDPVEGDRLVFDRLIGGLEPGQAVMVSGRRIRARIADTATELALVSADGSEQIALQPGDLLLVAGPATTEPTGQMTWQLIDRDGFVGSVAADPGTIVLQPAADDDPTIHEVAFLDDGPDAVVADRDRTTITLRDPLRHSYDRDTVRVNANVARSTHGETVREALGSGDGAQAHQRFAIKKPPLTFVAAPTPSGARSTLAVRVDGALWQEVPALYGQSSRAETYQVRLDGDGKTSVTFGDGLMGARLPTGVENVEATYRSGIGRAGMVGADKLTLLQTRPLGIRGVTNPLPAAGAAEPESLVNARSNAPMTVLTLDRIVSLQDFEDFVQAFAGIGKARAALLWRGESRLVHVTIAAEGGGEVPPSSDLYRNLVEAIETLRDPVQAVELTTYQSRTFSLAAGVLLDPRLVAEEILDRVAAALRAAFGFEVRNFGQPVSAAEVTALIQSVSGVRAVDLDSLTLDDAGSSVGAQPPAVLPSRAAHRVGGTTQPAELLLLNPHGVELREMAP